MSAVIEHDGRYYRPESGLRRGLRALRQRLGMTGGAAVATMAQVAAGALKAKATPAVTQVREHAYSIIGYGVFDAAMFVHSVFTGLLVTGITFLVFQWQVSEEGEDESANYRG